jgi:hypothetical protein
MASCCRGPVSTLPSTCRQDCASSVRAITAGCWDALAFASSDEAPRRAQASAHGSFPCRRQAPSGGLSGSVSTRSSSLSSSHAFPTVVPSASLRLEAHHHHCSRSACSRTRKIVTRRVPAIVCLLLSFTTHAQLLPSMSCSSVLLPRTVA